MPPALPSGPRRDHPRPPRAELLVRRLASAGCVAPEEEAEELLEAARSQDDDLEALLARRLAGEPLAWVTGCVRFAACRIVVHPGVYVPRWQSEPLARRAAALLPETGVGVDLCTGAGAIAAVMTRSRPGATVIGTELDPAARSCARANGVAVVGGSLTEALPGELAGTVDVVTAVPPYVPTASIALLPRDVQDYEPRLALDGGPDGTEVARRLVIEAAELLRPGGTLLVELGADQDEILRPVLSGSGFEVIDRLLDDDGELRGIEARRTPQPAPPIRAAHTPQAATRIPAR